MITRKETLFEKGTPYHILTRAVEKRKIFANEDDCSRFVFQMYAAHIGRPASNLHRRDIIRAAKALLRGEKISEKLVVVEHKSLVDILSFALVVTHIHFILVASQENAIPKYMQKLNIGFAKYFNLKHAREGTLFARPYKIIPIKTDYQLDAVIRYVNIKNPLDVYQPDWREKGLKDKKGALDFLDEYQFSSFPDLFGARESSLTSRSLLESYLGANLRDNKGANLEFIKNYLGEDLFSLNSFFLEE